MVKYGKAALFLYVFLSILNIYRDLCYYQMLTWWGGVVVMPNAGYDYVSDYYSRESETSILQMIEEELSGAINNLDSYTNISSSVTWFCTILLLAFFCTPSQVINVIRIELLVPV